MHKYQFYISFNDKVNTAASKAIEDCRKIFSEAGYLDYTVHANVNFQKTYLWSVFKTILKLVTIHPKSVVAVQYPLLSGNMLFKYVIKILHLKKAKVFCIIHDIEELRLLHHEKNSISREANLLNYYDCIIVHNDSMRKWLQEKGVTSPMVALQIFDYLSPVPNPSRSEGYSGKETIAFAGNLSKSNFIYSLRMLADWQFNVYGPNYLVDKGAENQNIHWKGSLSSEDILHEIKGDFGLIWDGDEIEHLDSIYGNYLKFNNPHKLSLYLAAGLPVIAPKQSAVAQFITMHDCGILVDSLLDLNDMVIEQSRFTTMKRNAMLISNQLRAGDYLRKAIVDTEVLLNVFR